MTRIKEHTLYFQCDRCGNELRAASGAVAHQLHDSPEEMSNLAAKAGWALEADGQCECAGCAVELHGKDGQ